MLKTTSKLKILITEQEIQNKVKEIEKNRDTYLYHLNEIESMNLVLDEEEKILAFKEFFTIKRDDATRELKMTQLVYPCDSNLDCLHNEQVIHSLNAVCGVDIKIDSELDKIIEEVLSIK